MRQKLRDIWILHSSDQNYILRYIRFSSFQSTCHHKHTLHCTHTEIIVILLWKLLTRKFIKFCHLFAQFFSRSKSLGEKHDLSYKSIIWNHHRYRSKESFEVIRKFSSTCITWIHCNKDSKIMIEMYIFSTQNKILILFSQQKCLSNRQHLLSNDW